MAEDCGGGVAEVGVDQLSRDDAMAKEGLAWNMLAELVMGVWGAYGWRDGCMTGRRSRKHRACSS